jgi:hypothetical protein
MSRSDSSSLQVITAANAIANDSSSTTLAIQFKSSSVAAACVSLALRTQEFKVSSLEKWAPKWNEERLRDTDPRLQSASVLIEEQEGDIYAPFLAYCVKTLLSFWWCCIHGRHIQSAAGFL